MKKEETKMNKIKCKIDEGKEKVKEKVKEVDNFVKDKPYKFAGITAGVGLLLGSVATWFLMRKKKKND